MTEEEKKENKFPSSWDKSYDRASFELLKHKEFWFVLGYGSTGELTLSSNCYDWSNAFNIKHPSIKLIYEVLNYHDNIDLMTVKSIVTELNEQHNKFFFCKEDYKRLKTHSLFKQMAWHYYPTENYRECVELEFKNVAFDIKTLKEEGLKYLNKEVL